ncbi:MAG: SPASM domain-containing protein [Fibrobacter sp.]|nr:SPASM domain-containing protein [Fibrobacter sp.]
MNGVYIEITDVCNFHCSFCPCGKRNESTAQNVSDNLASNARTFMSSALFERCISEASQVASQVYFHVLGEPTLHPGFAHYLKKLEETPLKLNLTTNGSTIERVGRHILQSPSVRQVNFSTHAYGELPEDQAAETLRNVLDFCRLAIVIRPDLYINLRLWNVDDERSRTWNKYMLETVNSTFNKNAVITPEHFCSRHKSFPVEGRVYIHQDTRFQWPELRDCSETADCGTPLQGTCHGLNTHCAILHDGRVVACCLDYKGEITLGHIQEQSLSEIFQSPSAKNIREGFARQELRHPLCKNCNFCKRFRKR